MKLTALAALGVYLLWQAINPGTQIAGTGPEGIDLIDLVRNGIAPSLALASLLLPVVVVLFRWAGEVGLAQGPPRGCRPPLSRSSSRPTRPLSAGPRR